MAWKRGSTWYLKRRLPGVDRKVYKSLDTVSKGRAHDLERVLLSLCERGRVEPVNAWLADRVSIHDLHANIMHLLGIDHTKLTYRFAGRDIRLTDIHGKIIPAIMS